MITSLREMLELPNFGNMTTSTTQFDSCDKTLFAISQQGLEQSILLKSSLQSCFSKQHFKTPKKSKELKLCIKTQFFSISREIADFP